MRWLDKYIVYSSIFALFTEDFSVRYIIDLKLFYVILLINFVLIARSRKLTVHKNLLIILAFFLVHGLIFFFWYSNPIKSLIAQLLGISFSSVYYYNFLKHYGSNYLFERYLDMAFAVAVLAIPMFYLNINVFIYNRLNGILSEPAHYAAIMLPATYAFMRKKKFFKLALLVLTLFLSNSTIGYIGLVLILFVPLIKSKYLVRYAWVALIILGSSAYYISTQWNKPIDENESNVLVRRLKQTKESLNAIRTGTFDEYTNLSTYAFLSNTFITKNIVSDKPLGTGLGSYPYEYDNYYQQMNPPPYLVKLNQSKINRTDANSLFLRLLSDIGIFSLLFFGFFIYWSYKLFRNDGKLFAQGCFFYLVTKLLREGHYFPPEFYFFTLIFLKDFDENTTRS